MDNKQFFELLKSNTATKQQKMEVLQYYIDNFPVVIDTQDPFNPFKKAKQVTKLQGVHIVNSTNPANDEKLVNHGFMQLKRFIKEMEEFVEINNKV